MSVLVKSMKMTDQCIFCNFNDDNMQCRAFNPFRRCPSGGVKPDWCPLVEVDYTASERLQALFAKLFETKEWKEIYETVHGNRLEGEEDE